MKVTERIIIEVFAVVFANEHRANISICRALLPNQKNEHVHAPARFQVLHERPDSQANSESKTIKSIFSGAIVLESLRVLE